MAYNQLQQANRQVPEMRAFAIRIQISETLRRFFSSNPPKFPEGWLTQLNRNLVAPGDVDPAFFYDLDSGIIEVQIATNFAN
jgi:hypothetical protein